MNIDIVDFGALRRAVGVLNAVSLLVMARWPRWLGPFRLETSVTYRSDQLVLHTTAILWLGVPMMKSAEELRLDEDGSHFCLTGTTRMTLAPWRQLAMNGHGQVEETATHATYALEWLGTRLKQTTTRMEQQVTLKQEAPGFVSNQVLTPVR